MYTTSAGLFFWARVRSGEHRGVSHDEFQTYTVGPINNVRIDEWTIAEKIIARKFYKALYIQAGRESSGV